MIRLTLDSGAFSAWRKSLSVDLGLYVEFVQEVCRIGDLVETYIVLDKIPGKPHEHKSYFEVEEAALQSFSNYRTMRKHGLEPMAVFHHFESFDWFRRYCDLGADYIGLSPSKDLMPPDRIRWLRKTFDLIDQHYGLGKVRLHGLGLASFSQISKFPWTSFDASTWAVGPGRHRIIIPRPSTVNSHFPTPSGTLALPANIATPILVSEIAFASLPRRQSPTQRSLECSC